MLLVPQMLFCWVPAVVEHSDMNNIHFSTTPAGRMFSGENLISNDVNDVKGSFGCRIFMLIQSAAPSPAVRDLGLTLDWCAEASQG